MGVVDKGPLLIKTTCAIKIENMTQNSGHKLEFDGLTVKKLFLKFPGLKREVSSSTLATARALSTGKLLKPPRGLDSGRT